MISDIVMNVLPCNNMKHQNSVISVIHRVSHSTLFNEEWSITGIVGVAGCDLWQLWCCKYENGVGWILQQFDLLLILVKTVA
ncbi:hypothetical protein KY284_029845 [Solanum tuberosum]|nr:hypothetical protein KY284_029845 [Solanum tuberosum]